MATDRWAVEGVPAIDGWLWLVAVAFLGIGDVVSTTVGLSIEGIYEAGPVTAVAVHHFGLASMLVLKVGLFAGCYLLWRYSPRPHCLGVPLGLAIVGVTVTTWNLHVLVVVALL